MSRGLFQGTLKFGAKAIGGAVAVFLIVGAVVMVTTSRDPKKAIAASIVAPEPPPAPPLLIVVDDESARDRYDAQWLNGMVVNQTAKAYKFVQISYDLFDASGAQIGTATASTRGLEPHGRWLFKTVISDQCTRFKLAALDGY